ncbi:MAG: hypothetical protein PWR14_980 [Thermosediminibacterales bacterium]|nr:hypothetical protein [Thermosediminibacterales bacterium]
MAKVKKEMAEGFADGELWDVLSDLVDDLNAIKDLVNDLKTKYNSHTHVENVDASYTQNATTQGPSATTAVADVTLKTTK